MKERGISRLVKTNQYLIIKVPSDHKMCVTYGCTLHFGFCEELEMVNTSYDIIK